MKTQLVRTGQWVVDGDMVNRAQYAVGVQWSKEEAALIRALLGGLTNKDIKTALERTAVPQVKAGAILIGRVPGKLTAATAKTVRELYTHLKALELPNVWTKKR